MMLWYLNNRYTLDTWRSLDLSAPEMNITRKPDIDIPTIVYSRLPGAEAVDDYVAATEVTDWTLIDSTGVQYSAEAEAITTFTVGTNARLYNHIDFMAADNSLAGEVTPGAIGANVVTNTIVPWILDRVNGATDVLTPQELGIE